MHPRLLAVLLLLLPFSAFAADDLTVGWISRQPEIDYVWNSSNPKVEGWPAAGAAISWRAHVRNWRAESREDVPYRWTLDGTTIASGTIDLAANAYTTVDLPATWSFDRHQLAFAIDDEQLTVFTDALAVGFWVEQSVYDWFRAHQHRLGIGSNSWEDWAQRHIELFNDMARMAIYPETPNGVLDRWRLQKVVVVPDGALPLVPLPDEGQRGGEPTGSQRPNDADRSVDIVWGFRHATLGAYTDISAASRNNPFFLHPVLLHELGHARYLLDVYGWNVRNENANFVIAVTENGQPIAQTVFERPFAFRTPEQGLMNEHYTFIDRYSAIALNLIAGHRATRGNYNEPENFASFMNDLPSQNRLTIRDASGKLMTNAKVSIYQSVADAPAWYATHFDNTPDLVLQTDANGQVLVGRNPFSNTRDVYQYWRGTNDVALVRVEKDGSVAFGFLESRIFNLAYWRGETTFADHDFTIGARLCNSVGPSLRSPNWDAKVTAAAALSWTALTGATGYRVYASVDGAAPRLLGATTDTVFAAPPGGRVYWWVEADVVGCGVRRSEASRYATVAPARRRSAR